MIPRLNLTQTNLQRIHKKNLQRRRVRWRRVPCRYAEVSEGDWNFSDDDNKDIRDPVHLFSYSFFTKDVVIGFVIFENCNDKIQASFTSFISLLKCIHVLNNVPWLQFLLFCTLYCTGRSHKLSSFSGRLNSNFVITAEFAWNIKHNTGNTIK